MANSLSKTTQKKIKFRLSFLKKSFVEPSNGSETFVPAGNPFQVYPPISSPSHSLQDFDHYQFLHEYPCPWRLDMESPFIKRATWKPSSCLLPVNPISQLASNKQSLFSWHCPSVSLMELQSTLNNLIRHFLIKLAENRMEKANFFLLDAPERLKMLWVSGHPSQRRKFYNVIITGKVIGAGVIAQLMKWLPCKHEDLSLNLQNAHKKIKCTVVWWQVFVSQY